ncbi:nitroreductase family protein [Bacteroidales bacterium OttesenSCG-928-C03]|nr:nitroreductase family protein [Bacteroidales bacterium OttesenSCG-928-E04]MDL2308610.1 nitroreductase family protein [Bacteroidales bacterium OttesenSCG-928-C03]
MIRNLILKNRSYRRFYGDHKIERKVLEELIDLARLSPTGRNLQPLKYAIVNEEDTNASVFSTLAWAGYLKDWDGPEVTERPTAYIIMLVDKNLTTGTPAIDEGIASQSILLGAVEKGLGGCIIQSVKRADLAEIIKLPESLEIALVIALGKPKEEVQIVDVQHDDIKYYRDEKGVHYVPKRNIDDILLK